MAVHVAFEMENLVDIRVSYSPLMVFSLPDSLRHILRRKLERVLLRLDVYY